MRALGLLSRAPRARTSSRTRARRTAPTRDGLRAGAERLRRGVQLLPGEEPRRDGRRGRARHGRRRARRPRARAARARPDREVPARRSRATPLAWTRSRRSCCATSCRCSTRGTTQRAALPRFYREALAGVGDLDAAAGAAEGSEPVWHLYVDPDGASPSGSRDFLTASAASRRAGTIRSPPHLSAAYADLGYAPGAFPVAEAISPRRSLAADLPGHHRAAARRPSSRRSRDFFDGLGMAGPANDAPYRLIRRRRLRRRRRRPGVHEPLRLPDRRRHARSARSSRSSAASRSARAARSRATRSSATASRSRTRSSSATA